MTTLEGALVEPAAVGMHAAILGGAKPGMSIVILGGGTTGLMTMQAWQEPWRNRYHGGGCD